MKSIRLIRYLLGPAREVFEHGVQLARGFPPRGKWTYGEVFHPAVVPQPLFSLAVYFFSIFRQYWLGCLADCLHWYGGMTSTNQQQTLSSNRASADFASLLVQYTCTVLVHVYRQTTVTKNYLHFTNDLTTNQQT